MIVKKVKQYSSNSQEILNDYIPLRIIFSDNSDLSSNQYYRYGNGETSLIEVCIHSITGILKEVIIVLLGNCKIIDDSFDLANFKITAGIPLFNVEDIIDNNPIDEFSSDAKIMFFNNAFIIDIHDYSVNEEISYIQCDHVIFRVNENKKVISLIIMFKNKSNKKGLLKFCS